MISSTNSKTGDSPGNTRPGTPAYWVFVIGLVVSSCLFWYWDMVAYRSGRSMAIGLALFVFVPCVAGPFCRALGQNVAAAACASILAGSYWTVIFFVVFVNGRESFGELLVRLLYIAQLFLPAVFIALAITASMNKRLGPGWAMGTVGIGFLCGAIGAGAVVASKEAARTHPVGADPGVLGSDMMTINKCSQDFARSNPEKGYPEALGQLGPQGSGCVPQAVLAGQVKGFTITYEPAAKDVNGKIGGYKVVAREAAPVVKDIGSIFTDESGLVRIHFDGLTSDLPGPSTSLGPLLECVRKIASGGVRIKGVLISDEDEVMRTCMGSALVAKHTYQLSTNNIGAYLGLGVYNFEYNLNTGKSGEVTSFTVEARPKPYGVAGVRSYLAVETIDQSKGGGFGSSLDVYATPEDRPATVNDPLATASEVGLWASGPWQQWGIGCGPDTAHCGSVVKK
jgi:hypothetical protein